jgi:CubicO group peptidase (beta-lactamase class C family)
MLICLGSLVPAEAGTATFIRGLETWRRRLAVPGLSWAIVRPAPGDGTLQTTGGALGLRDLEHRLPAQTTTRYPIASLTKPLAAALLLRLAAADPPLLAGTIRTIDPGYPFPETSFLQALSHTASGRGRWFHYEPPVFVRLTPAIERLGGDTIDRLLAREILGPLGMRRTAFIAAEPVEPAKPADQETAACYATDGKAPRRTGFPTAGPNCSSGLVATTEDLARFAGALLEPGLIPAAFAEGMRQTPADLVFPAAWGWFVETAFHERVLWQYGWLPGSSSSLFVIVPGRRLALIVLANSDGLSAPFPLADGALAASPIANLFLRLFAGSGDALTPPDYEGVDPLLLRTTLGEMAKHPPPEPLREIFSAACLRRSRGDYHAWRELSLFAVRRFPEEPLLAHPAWLSSLARVPEPRLLRFAAEKLRAWLARHPGHPQLRFDLAVSLINQLDGQAKETGHSLLVGLAESTNPVPPRVRGWSACLAGERLLATDLAGARRLLGIAGVFADEPALRARLRRLLSGFDPAGVYFETE